ncbi:septum site-determining protein MinC [Rhodoligotrophos defluvii]|uniref:septum site-determining protein MinC n=1 Tax=Rhodoligotrophos defluvii TaxID=2561934 RepID=UPI0010C9CECD|nr:septum site-determining protein MinC [Rhodoligotrophos defluvii]
MNCATPVQKKSIRFRARSFVAFALTPEPPLTEWLRGLDRWTENSPGFFTRRPVVLDLNVLKPANVSEIEGLISELAERGIRIYAIEAYGLDGLGPDLPPLLTGAKEASLGGLDVQPAQNGKAASPARPEERQDARSLLIKSPVRSGQSVFHPHGDVIILGSVSSGSEIIAGGSIHVYGALRGCAFAGATGNAEARIFCLKNEAELLAVDGWYRTAEDMDSSSRGRPVQAFLENGVIWVAPLT